MSTHLASLAILLWKSSFFLLFESAAFFLSLQPICASSIKRADMPSKKKDGNGVESTVQGAKQGIIAGTGMVPDLHDLDPDTATPVKKRAKKKVAAAPSQYYIYENPDKKNHRKPPENNPCQPGHPSRIIIVGVPGCGKRSVMMNILENYDFDFDTVTEVHASARSEEHEAFEDAEDYQLYQWNNEVDKESDTPWKLIGPPPVSRFEKRGPTGERLNHLLIMDEPPCNWTARMEREVGTLMNYNSTHNDCTVFLITQHFQSLPLQIRGAATHFVFFPDYCPHNCRFMGRASGSGVDMEQMFRRHCRSNHDSIMVDRSGLGPKLRRNVYEPIKDGHLEQELPIEKYNKKKRKRSADPEDGIANVEDDTVLAP